MGTGALQLGASAYFAGGVPAIAATAASGIFVWSGEQYRKAKYALGDYGSAAGAAVLTFAMTKMSGGLDQCINAAMSGRLPSLTVPVIVCATAAMAGALHTSGKLFGFKSWPLLSRPLYLIAPALSMLSEPILAIRTVLATTSFAQADSQLKLSDNNGNPRPPSELGFLERTVLRPLTLMPRAAMPAAHARPA